jgi:uncharacterized protein YoxC
MENNTTLIVILIILSAAFLLFAGFSIPFLLQIWRTAKGMSRTLDLLNESLPAIMKNLEEITTHMSQTSTTVHRQVEALAQLMHRIRGTLALLVGVEEIARRGFHLPFAPAVRTSLAVVKGLRVFMNVLKDQPPPERRSNG